MVDKIVTLIQESIGLEPPVQYKIFNSLILIVVVILIRVVAARIIWRQTTEAKTRYIWRKTLNYIITIAGLIVLVSIWFRGFKQLGTYFGLLSAGLAIAMRDPLANLAGWISIITQRTFTVGDRIEIGEVAGDVIDIGMSQFTLLEIGNWVDADQSTGRIVHVPNSWVFTNSCANYSKGFQYVWNELPVLLTFESDWRKGKEILLNIARKHAEHLSKSAERKVKQASRKFMIFYSNLTPTVYTSVEDCGVLLTVRYLCEPRRRRSSAQSVWEDVLKEFAKCDDIDFAYPTQRRYDNFREGKSGLKPDAGKKTTGG